MLKPPAFSTSFLESRMIQKLKSRKSRIKPGLFAFLLAERIIFGKKTQKSQVSLLRYLTFSLVCGRIWQRGTAAPCAVRVVGACSPVGCVQARPSRQARQVRCLSMPVFPSVRTRCTSLQHPKRTRFRLFRPKPGAFFSFSLFWDCKISACFFVHPAI